jgi:hypothetical protein
MTQQNCRIGISRNELNDCAGAGGVSLPVETVATPTESIGIRRRDTPFWRRLLETYFYFGMSLLIALTVVYGFSRTIEKNLIHPSVPRPAFLYVHVAVFTGWLAFFILQSALVRSGHVKLHRRIGWYGLVHGIAIPLVGVPIAVIMGRFHLHVLRDTETVADLAFPLWDMVAFSVPFALAVYWRKRPEFHRRLMLMATCALTAAAFGRFPPQILPPVIFYAGVDVLILLGVVRDLVVEKRVHRVYAIGLPLLLIAQIVVTYAAASPLPAWVKIARAIVG